ncbi:putative uncharacterized protein DDB_G0277255 [Microplitis mediator]|uniref:putative uncharacterized protein DDB_G0277255 n=1 Tax=Microplitis mediator TaxID=375433 RepID=UPI0025548A46|nr:putative uncharacterized protein DDB_G0277255 [Microplitis mediator]
MNEEEHQKSFIKHLTAKELLESNSLRARVSNEFEQVSKVLPKTGVKLFQPNGSWLQNRQINACLEAQRDLIKVERVKKLSKLAVGEWLPQEKRVKVIKRSGIDWNNYGCDLRGTLYLNPEEALLQLELNCLDLIYNHVSLSIQQAYELLINSPNSDCTLEEYRVYSQLAKLGYRLKRFYYQNSINEKLDECTSVPKKKVIIDPESCQWMTGVSLNDKTNKNLNKDAKFVINSIIEKIEIQEQKLKVECDENVVNKIDNDVKDKGKRRLNIVSVETMVDPVKLVATTVKNTNKESGSSIGIRIQRNVKLLPKRTDKVIISSSSSLPLTSSSSSSLSSFSNSNTDLSAQIKTSDKELNSNNDKNNQLVSADKRKMNNIDLLVPSLPTTSCTFQSPLPEASVVPVKKFKKKKIESSDDEIEEIPRTLTRMEMLNSFPNLASKDSIVVITDRKYIPHNIKPVKAVHTYDKFNSKDNNNKNKSCNSIIPIDSYNKSKPPNTLLESNRCSRNNNNRHLHNQSGANNNTNTYSNKTLNNFTHHGVATDYSINSNQQQNIMSSNRWSSLHVNFFKNIAMATYALRASITQNITNIYQQSTIYNMEQFFGQHNSRFFNPSRAFNYHQKSNMPIYYNSNKVKIKNTDDNNPNNNNNDNDNDDYFEFKSSFDKIPANSWSELKKKWKEAKTITIEDDNDEIDCCQVEVVNKTIQPLVGAKYSSNLKQIYDRLKIIKPAQEKIVRKKRGYHKISYKVYSNTQLYRKASPGPAMFHLVITSQENNNFIQPIELNRLYQDGDGIAIVFAYVAGASISFMQAGIVSLPNFND